MPAFPQAMPGNLQKVIAYFYFRRDNNSRDFLLLPCEVLAEMSLCDFFRKNPRVTLAVSGGTDSSYLLYAALKSGADVLPCTVKTQFQPEFELEDARRLAGYLGVALTVINCDILSCPKVAGNQPDRCYYCKKAIFSLLGKRARMEGYPLLIDGTNASDDAGDRLGMRALKELGVRSPLRECGLDKSAVRRRSQAAGLFTWDKPSYACLATRFPTGVLITEKLLQNVEDAENSLFQLGFSNFRVRFFHGAARLQLPADQLERAVHLREEIHSRLSPYFSGVLLDLKER